MMVERGNVIPTFFHFLLPPFLPEWQRFSTSHAQQSVACRQEDQLWKLVPCKFRGRSGAIEIQSPRYTERGGKRMT